jgi:hypothetical protein
LSRNVGGYHFALRNMPEECRSHLYRGGSTKSLIPVTVVCIENFVRSPGAESLYFLLASLVISNLVPCTDNLLTGLSAYGNRECTECSNEAGYKIQFTWSALL